jgi:hypothetical protein
VNTNNLRIKNVTGTPIIAAMQYAANLFKWINFIPTNTAINWIIKFGTYEIQNLTSLLKVMVCLNVK